MKKVISVFLAVLLIFTTVSTAAAEPISGTENEMFYASLPVEYAGNGGVIEHLRVLVKDNYVLADAEQLGSRLGCNVKLSNDGIAISNNGKGETIDRLSVFRYNSKTVLCRSFGTLIEYTGPCETVKNDDGIWVPLKYMLFSMGSNLLVSATGDYVTIEMPTLDLLDTLSYIRKNHDDIFYNYFTDLYDSELRASVVSVLSRFINMLNGLITFEGASWLAIIEAYAAKTTSLDTKFGEKFAKLFCTNSSDELKETNERISLFTDVLGDDGKLADALEMMGDDYDSDVGRLFEECQNLFGKIKENNSALQQYNVKYKQLENLLDEQDLFTDIANAAQEVQGAISEVTKTFSVLGKVVEFVGYLGEYANRDSYAINALQSFTSTYTDDRESLNNMVKAMRDYSKVLESDILTYSVSSYLKNNALDIIQDMAGVSLSSVLGGPATLLLLAWDLASNLIPFIRDGLSSADNAELAIYSTAFLDSAYLGYVDYRCSVHNNQEMMTVANAYKLSRYAYTYLKSAYITRAATIGSLEDVKNKENAKAAIAELEKSNKKIAGYLADVKMLEADNSDYSLGFLPESSKKLVASYTDADLLRLFGKDVEIPKNVRQTSSEKDIVLVLDNSGSMSGAPLNETKTAAGQFVENILAQDAAISLVTYNSMATERADFSMNSLVLNDAIDEIDAGGGTSIDMGLSCAERLLEESEARKKIIVLMSDGEPNEGRVGDELVSYANSLKDKGIYIYTLGFFENVSDKSAPQALMEKLASDGCHFEVDSAVNLTAFFNDIADQLNGQQYVYVRVACPVSVEVTHNGETLSSADDNYNARTTFGVLTVEQQQDSDDTIKTLRLKSGADYDIRITGTGRGKMDYTIGFMNDDGDYTDLRRFKRIPITKQTVIDTSTERSGKTQLNVDTDGDGRYDEKYRAGENGYGKLVDNSFLLWIALGFAAVAAVLIAYIVIRKKIEKKKQKRKVA